MRFCIDMDGVVTDFVGRALKIAEKNFGIKETYENVKHMQMGQFILDRLTEEKKEEMNIKTTYGVYKDMCPRNFFRKLKGLPGAVKAIQELIKAGHEIVFVTKPLDWKYCTEEKEDWLAHRFGGSEEFKVEPPFSLFMVRRIQDKHMVSADYYIDDDPRVLREVAPEKAICVSQPWNQDYINNEFKGRVVKSMKEVASLVKSNKIQ